MQQIDSEIVEKQPEETSESNHVSLTARPLVTGDLHLAKKWFSVQLSEIKSYQGKLVELICPIKGPVYGAVQIRDAGTGLIQTSVALQLVLAIADYPHSNSQFYFTQNGFEVFERHRNLITQQLTINQKAAKAWPLADIEILEARGQLNKRQTFNCPRYGEITGELRSDSSLNGINELNTSLALTRLLYVDSSNGEIAVRFFLTDANIMRD